MRKILLILLVFIFIASVSASDGNDYFNSWVDNYYESNHVTDEDLHDFFDEYADDESMDKDDFNEIKFVYDKVYSYKDSKIIKIMNKDFKNADKNHDGELSFKEFKKMFKKMYSYYRASPSEYSYFMKTDWNGNGLVDYDELSEISYVFAEDSFWDGYPIEEIIQSELEQGDRDGDGYLNFTEFKRIA